MQAYKPSKKGLRNFTEEDRIFFVNNCYVWFRKVNSVFVYGASQGYKIAKISDLWRGSFDMIEKKNLKKPDSFWVPAENIDPKTIERFRDIDEKSKKLLVS